MDAVILSRAWTLSFLAPTWKQEANDLDQLVVLAAMTASIVALRLVGLVWQKISGPGGGRRDRFTDYPQNIGAKFALPRPPKELVGRKRELKALLARLAPTKTPRSTAGKRAASGVVISAMGGTGKTALALTAGAVAHRKQWFCAALFVDLRNPAPGAEPLSAEAALKVLLSQMDVKPEDIPHGLSKRSALYQKKLDDLARNDSKHRPVLVVADNANSTAQVHPLLPRSGGHRLMVTSRSGLPLTGIRHLDLNVLSPRAARRVLVSALPANDARAHDKAGLRHLVELCGYLPLALEIAAAHLTHNPHLTLKRLAERLEQAASRVNRLKNPDQDTDQAQVLREFFDPFLTLLDETEVRVFLLVASAPGPTTSTTTAAVMTGLAEDEVEQVLERLAAVRLLTQPAPGRWNAHDVLADYATTHPLHNHSQALTRLLDHYTDTARAADTRQEISGKRFTSLGAALVWLDRELDTLTTAALAAPALGHTRAAIHLSLALVNPLERECRFEDWEQVCRSAQNVARDSGDQDSEAAARYHLGRALERMDQFDEAADTYRRAADLYQQAGDASGEAAARSDLGRVLERVGRLDEAADAHRRTREFFHQRGNITGEAAAWSDLGQVLERMDRFDEAADAYRRAADLYQRERYFISEAAAWSDLGRALERMDQLSEAADAYRRSADLYQRERYLISEEAARDNLGRVLKRAGRVKEADRAFARAREIREQRHRPVHHGGTGTTGGGRRASSTGGGWGASSTGGDWGASATGGDGGGSGWG